MAGEFVSQMFSDHEQQADPASEETEQHQPETTELESLPPPPIIEHFDQNQIQEIQIKTEKKTPKHHQLILLGSRLTLVFAGSFFLICLPSAFYSINLTLLLTLISFMTLVSVFAYQALKIYNPENVKLCRKAEKKIAEMLTRPEAELAENLSKFYSASFGLFLTFSSILLIVGDLGTQFSSGCQVKHTFSCIGFLTLALLTFFFVFKPKQWQFYPLSILTLTSMILAINLIVTSFEPMTINNRLDSNHNEYYTKLFTASSDPMTFPDPTVTAFAILKFAPPLPIAVLCFTHLIILTFNHFSLRKLWPNNLFFGIIGLSIIKFSVIFHYLMTSLLLVIGGLDQINLDIIRILPFLLVPILIPIGFLISSFPYRKGKLRKILTFFTALVILFLAIFTLVTLVEVMNHQKEMENFVRNVNNPNDKSKFCLR